MKSVATILVLLSAVILDFNDIAKINSLKEEAERAYKSKNFKVAYEKYRLLVDSFKVTDDNLLLNYANSGYYLTGLNGKIDEMVVDEENTDYAEVVMSRYHELTASKDKSVRSAAYNQLGVINYQMGKNVQQGDKFLDESLAFFKQSLVSNSGNDNARYNYEIVKKELEEQENEEQQQQDQQDNEQDQENKEDQQQQNENEQQNQENQEQNQDQQEQQDQQNDQNENEQQQNQEDQQEQQDQNQQQQEQQQNQEEQQQEEQQPQQSPSEKLKEMNISEEMAKMILEALRNNEVQYIQQQKRKPTKKADSKKPDW